MGGRSGNPARVDGLHRLALSHATLAGLDLDKDQGVATLDNKIDFSERRFVATGADAIEFDAQEKCRQRFPTLATAFGLASVSSGP